MITYIEKGKWMHEAIGAAGHRFEQVNGAWVSSDDAAVQAIIDSFDPLPFAKADKIDELTLEAARRVTSVYPHMNESPKEVYSQMQTLIDLYTHIAPAARQALSGNLLAMKNVRDTFDAAKAAINAMTDWKLVVAYDVASAPGW